MHFLAVGGIKQNKYLIKIMGNAISSIKSGFSICREFVQGLAEGFRFMDYRFKCQSYPLVENIVDTVIILPCQFLLLSPLLITGLSIEALRNYPVLTLSHCYVNFILRVPLFSKNYILIMGAFQIGYYILQDLKNMKESDWEAIHRQTERELTRNRPYEWSNIHQMYIVRL